MKFTHSAAPSARRKSVTLNEKFFGVLTRKKIIEMKKGFNYRLFNHVPNNKAFKIGQIKKLIWKNHRGYQNVGNVIIEGITEKEVKLKLINVSPLFTLRQ
jgi:hypothetical protein